MHLLQGDAFNQLFREDWQRAFHLETLDTYNIPEEREPIRKFLAGEPDGYEWCKSWDNLVHEVTSRGKVVQRVRLVSVPHVDYTRFGLAIAPLNIAAGEDIRWLPRHLIDSDQLTTDDWWMFDDNTVAFSVFTPDGRGGGLAVTTDPTIAAYVATVRDLVWKLAIPHADYVNGEHTARL